MSRNRMADDEKAVMEGFLCPICKADLGTPDQLVTHFQNEHSEDQDLLKSFKDLLGIAKKKILKEDGSSSLTFGKPKEIYQWEPQEIGASTSHLKSFEEARSARLQRLFVPTNQLIIRLDKLLDNMPTDPLKKKAHEQNVVPWLDGDAVPRCPNCTRSFHVARRQHHCRLCGSIMCDDCSLFLPLSTAMKMLDKATEEVRKHSEMTLRVCSHCLSLLEGREKMKESRRCKPLICQLYEKLVECREQADEHAAMYIKMCNSLSDGETIYSLNDAQALRMTIVKLAESIDGISGKILNLDGGPEGGSAAGRLQKSVRMATTAYLRTQLLRLPSLLSETDYKYAQFRRRQQIQAKIQEEKTRESKLKSPVGRPELNASPQHRIAAPASTNDIQDVSVGQGWVPEKKKFFDVDDPLLLQMNILRNYIQEARAAHKYDEVVSLEANLQELKDEYWKQQQERDEMASKEESYTSGSDTTTTLESTERDEGSQSNNSDNI
ncbi:rabenosyn-5 isoform X2 [Nilaparvata lugens]|nr:rabenosyn-5 isoform X2 [Nilaparvata lugens]